MLYRGITGPLGFQQLIEIYDGISLGGQNDEVVPRPLLWLNNWVMTRLKWMAMTYFHPWLWLDLPS